MSKINAVRLINLNYNNNAIRISDEIFQLNGESTLLSLRNGGGKSVLVQMITAPFVHKRYRDAKDRPFESYFTTNKPTFILVEWSLDQGAGYVLTGMMVRRSQEVLEHQTDSLEIINFISEYKERCQQDIYHIPVVEKTKKEMVLKNFGACKQLFESYKKERINHFAYFDMNNGSQSKQYFEKLKEYQINYKEWETIIKKVNLKESGLSDLFADCKDEKGLVEKWFLDAVESKLNKDRNRMKEFQTIIEKYVAQYKDNKSKIERRNTIRLFKEEAAGIAEKAQEYQLAANREQEMENQIAGFIQVLEQLEQDAGILNEEAERQYRGLEEEIAALEYEQLSQEIHDLIAAERFHTSNRDMIGMERDDLEQEHDQINHLLHLFAAAKQQAELDEYRMDYSKAKQRLEVFKQEEEELEPERQSLGARLKSYYRKRLEQNRIESEQKAAQQQETAAKIVRQKKHQQELTQQQFTATEQKGTVLARLKGYDEAESRFNRKFNENLSRNILGEYEPGELEIRIQKYEKQLETVQRECRKDKQALQQGKENLKISQRTLEDKKTEQMKLQGERQDAERILHQLEAELLERKAILRYFDLPESEQFETETILSAAERKLSEIESVRRQLEKEENELQTDYVRLTQGKVLELPEEFEELLGELGLHSVFGMDWLHRNGYTLQRNQELIRRIPFLPYGLILSRQDLKKLSDYAKEVYTSFPIPIIIRETLETASSGGDGTVIDFSEVSFYVLFNENLLDEAKLSELVKEKEVQLQKKQHAIDRKKSEYEEYFEKKERIKNQRVTSRLYKETNEKLSGTNEKIAKLEASIRQIAEEIDKCSQTMADLERQIQKHEKEQQQLSRCLEECQELHSSYQVYLEQRREFERLEKQMQRLDNQRNLALAALESLEEQQQTQQAEHDGIKRKESLLQAKAIEYAEYDAAKASQAEPEWNPDIADKEILTEMEARYQAITASISMALKELEEQVQTTRRRFEKAEQELHEITLKFSLKPEEWSSILYNKKEELHQESLLEDRKKRLRLKDKAWNDEDKSAAIVTQQIKERVENMRKKFGKEEPVPKAEIRTIDFAARMNELNYQKQEIKKVQQQWERKLHSYEDNLTALSEYAHFPIITAITWEQHFADMNQKELREFKGTLVRDYKSETEAKRNHRDRLVRLLNQIVRKEEFQEDFYRKPLESILELADDAAQAISQLNTTIESYNRLMEKLEVDINMVEKEKQKIVELLGDYLEEVHSNLGKIDTNSTIIIRERPIKMLKIQLPDWTENETLYQVRLQDFLDELTEKGIEIYERNENAQEYFGTRITTKNLYDMVIGIGNVQIRLYKIEEQREYPITWSDVAKNSGGEGFLSAFIILSSLLYYMRKDDSDIFANKNEGKVLVMDNPFAQTNAAHLLKPLMDMAQKTNTQLICLSGLGGESIYNRFNNIYVLNLIAASLRSGMQYLKAEHMRGNEEETLIVSQIEVADQLTLF